MDKNSISPSHKQDLTCYSREEVSNETSMLFENLEWVKSDVAAFILSMTVGALRTAVCRGEIKATTYRRKLYFKKKDLYKLLETSPTKGGF